MAMGRKPTARAKQIDVLRLAEAGKTREQIAFELNISTTSVYRCLAGRHIGPRARQAATERAKLIQLDDDEPPTQQQSRDVAVACGVTVREMRNHPVLGLLISPNGLRKLIASLPDTKEKMEGLADSQYLEEIQRRLEERVLSQTSWADMRQNRIFPYLCKSLANGLHDRAQQWRQHGG